MQTVFVAIATARQTSGVGKAGRQLQRLREQAVAEQHGDFIAPIRREGELAAPDFRLVHHVVMHQRGQMHHLDDDRRRDMRVAGLADGVGRQRDERGAQMLAAAVQRVLRVGNDLRVKIIDLLDQSLRHRLEKRLHRFHDLFPGTIRVRHLSESAVSALATFDSAASIRSKSTVKMPLSQTTCHFERW